MKELSMEEKAKRYDEALERAKGLVDFCSDNELKTLEYVFHELKESEDDGIRKEIISALKFANVKGVYDKHIGWLEKQDKQNPTDKVEHQFKVGDSIKTTNEAPLTITKITDSGYWSEDLFICSFENSTKWELVEHKPSNKVESKFKAGNWYQCTKDFFGKGITFDKNTAYYCAKEGCLQDEYGCHIAIVKDLYDNFKLWTIQDAKDGDVLYSLDSNQPFIYKERNVHEQATAYCGINKYGKFFVWNTKDCIITLDKYVPATKEQRDLLFQKMKEAGYEFDFEKKELKKIEKKSDWSEDDEVKLKEAICMIEANGNWVRSEDAVKDISNYLKSLKDRVQLQPKQEWSAVDESHCQMLQKVICNSSASASLANKLSDWLNSIKQRIGG